MKTFVIRAQPDALNASRSLTVLYVDPGIIKTNQFAKFVRLVALHVSLSLFVLFVLLTTTGNLINVFINLLLVQLL